MLGTKQAWRPAVPWLEFHSQEVPDFAIDTIPDSTVKLAFREADLDIGLKGYRSIQLDTRP